MNGLYFLIALVAGSGFAIQTSINSRLAAGLGQQPLVAALVSFAVGTCCLLLPALWLADWQAVSSNLAAQPWWRWIGGALGAGLVFLSVFLAPKLGVANVMFLFILGQLAGSMAVDHFGWFQMTVRPVHWWKLAGMAVMMVGVTLFVFGERWFK